MNDMNISETRLKEQKSYWASLWSQFQKRRLGYCAFFVVLLFACMGIYAPFLASSKPLWVDYNGEWYFPLFRYLFYPGFFTKRLDLFFNLMMFTLPAALIALIATKNKNKGWASVFLAATFIQCGLFIWLIVSPPKDPAANVRLTEDYLKILQSHPYPDWNLELAYMTPYAKLNLVLREQLELNQHRRLTKFTAKKDFKNSVPTLWQMEQNNQQRHIETQEAILKQEPPGSAQYKMAEAILKYILDRQRWINEQMPLLHYEAMPLLRNFHWEDDAGGSMSLNQLIPWWEVTRINRKDLVAALIFGTRISLVVGIIAVSIALSIGIPIGAFAGYYGGKFDIIVSRMLEIWESMPTFFMLLLVVAITQSKSIFLVIAVIGIFGWTGFSRYIRGEFFKQRNLPYVEACYSLGFNDNYIMFRHILPNAIPPLLTLLPFAIMGAITSEAGLSFLGLGEEGSCSWGVLMDEGRSVFPGESYLLWPPAILLTILLVAIALVGDALRDVLDPKMHRG